MKIAQIAPLAESCPPTLYGGTERIVSYLTECLVEHGHDVTLFASGDSVTKAALAPSSLSALRLNPAIKDSLPYHLTMVDEVKRRAGEFDILHFHTDLCHFPAIREISDRTVTTLHGRLDLPDLKSFFDCFSDIPLVSVSYSQRRPLRGDLNWAGNVYHGLPQNIPRFSGAPKDGYLAFIGRISPEKRPDRAIEIAVRSGLTLKMAAKIDNADRPYWNAVVEPLVSAFPNVEFIGEIGEREKGAFLGNARALLFPIDWPEPFGLVMIEAMACGTPVIAFNAGSVHEVVDVGLTGFVVDDIDGALNAISQLDSIDRATVRSTFERRFSVERMMEDYVDVYHRLLSARPTSRRSRRPARFPSGERDFRKGDPAGA
jgi:glycosyltransferase involved in cell wall biosynthesis